MLDLGPADRAAAADVLDMISADPTVPAALRWRAAADLAGLAPGDVTAPPIDSGPSAPTTAGSIQSAPERDDSRAGSGRAHEGSRCTVAHAVGCVSAAL
jgi:hypothetical protein